MTTHPVVNTTRSAPPNATSNTLRSEDTGEDGDLVDNPSKDNEETSTDTDFNDVVPLGPLGIPDATSAPLVDPATSINDVSFDQCSDADSNDMVSLPDSTFAPLADQSNNENDDNRQKRPPLCPGWTQWTDSFVHCYIPQAVTAAALLAIRRPRWTVYAIAAFSFGLIVLGYATNFTVSVEEFEVFAPYGVRPREHRAWIQNESGFPDDEVALATFVHKNGQNIVGVEGVQRAFDSYETVVQNAEGYHELCAKSPHIYNNTHTCLVSSVLRFWNYSRAVFEAAVSTDEQVAAIVQQDTYPDGTPVDTEAILGNYRWETIGNGTTTTITAQSFLTVFLLPNIELQEVRAFETVALEALFPLQEEINGSPEKYNGLRLEVNSERSYPDEFLRAIVKDMPLIPVVFLIMVGFTCAIFYRRDPVESRLLLGVGAVVTIVCSIMTGFGLMFVCGVPFSNLTVLVPFLIFGVGLDDTFIISGGFARTNPEHSMEERIRETMNDVGLSITVTTISTMLAFGLGTVSNIPAIRWMCLYSMTTIAIDFIYQITFFIALLTLDAQRIKENRKDCCVCITATKADDDNALAETESEEDVVAGRNVGGEKSSFMDRLMIWYSGHLLHPYVKVPVLVTFTLLFGLCAYSSSLLRQEFQVTELVPSDSYVIDFLDAFNTYRSRSLPIYVYFRFVDQSDEDMQNQMIQFIEDLVALDQFAEPRFCFVRDYQAIMQNESLSMPLRDLTFTEQIEVLLSNPTVQEIYGYDIVLDEEGNITASRCLLFTENLDLDVVEEQIELLNSQEEVSLSQPVNQGRVDWAFFSHDEFYLTWEFYDSIVKEWIITTIVGILAVTAISFLCIPHWSASLFVLPMIGVLYVDLVGIIQFSGLYINIVTYVSLAMSIGLLVDYIVHVLLRYFESKAVTREEKVKDTLRTMGSAVLSGGLSTLLGVVPLAFSTSQVIRTVFIAFFAMVALGCAHGLVLLPIVLSMVGPEDTVSTELQNKAPALEIDGKMGGKHPAAFEETIQQNESFESVGDIVEEISV